MAQPVYVGRTVQMDGTVLNTFDASLIAETATWTLNEQDEATLSIAKNAITDPNLAGSLSVLFANTGTGDDETSISAELQIIDTANDDKLIFWGPIIKMGGGGSDGSIHVTCAGVDWYLYRRFLDGTVTEYLSNVDFEDDFTDWLDQDGNTPGDVSTSPGISIDSNRVFTGNKAVKMVGLGHVAFADDKFIAQSANSIAGDSLGLALVASAWFWIAASLDFEAAIEGRGLYVETFNSGSFVKNNFYVLDSATPRGKWVKAETNISIPASATYDVHLRLYQGSTGDVWWDDVKLVQFDSFGFVDITGDEDTAADVGKMICHLVASVQNTDFGKSSVNITTDETDIGVLTMQTFFFSDHVQFDQAIEGFLNGASTEGGQDYAIIYDKDAGTRVFTNYARRGVDRTTGGDLLELIYSTQGATRFADRNCADYRWSTDGGQCITNQTVLGDDNGPDREEAIVDSGGFVGLMLQDVRQAPQNTEVRRLQGMAQARINLFSSPPLSIEMDVRPDAAVAMLGVLLPGDTVPLTIEDGPYWSDGLTGNFRVHQMKLDFRTGVLTVTLTLDGA